MKPKVKAGPAPQSVAAAEAAEARELKDKMEGNGVAQGEKPATPPPETPAGAPTRKERRRKASEKPKPSDIPKQGRTGRKSPPQPDLPGVEVKLDGVGKAARRFLEALDAVEKASTEKGESSAALISALKRSKRTSIQVEGYKFEYHHVGPKDTIKVVKPK